MTEPEQPRRPGRPRRVTAETAPEASTAAPEHVSAPPGPHQLEIRFNGKIVCLQRVHSYTIDQQADTLTVTGVLRKAD